MWRRFQSLELKLNHWHCCWLRQSIAFGVLTSANTYTCCWIFKTFATNWPTDPLANFDEWIPFFVRYTANLAANLTAMYTSSRYESVNDLHQAGIPIYIHYENRQDELLFTKRFPDVWKDIESKKWFWKDISEVPDLIKNGNAVYGESIKLGMELRRNCNLKVNIWYGPWGFQFSISTVGILLHMKSTTPGNYQYVSICLEAEIYWKLKNWKHGATPWGINKYTTDTKLSGIKIPFCNFALSRLLHAPGTNFRASFNSASWICDEKKSFLVAQLFQADHGISSHGNNPGYHRFIQRPSMFPIRCWEYKPTSSGLFTRDERVVGGHFDRRVFGNSHMFMWKIIGR